MGESGQGAGQAPQSVRHSLRKQGIQKYNQSSIDPRFAARVTKAWAAGDKGVELVDEGAGKHPSQSVILCESRESRNIISQAWTPAFTARVTNVSGREWPRCSVNSPFVIFAKAEIQKYCQPRMDLRAQEVL